MVYDETFVELFLCLLLKFAASFSPSWRMQPHKQFNFVDECGHFAQLSFAAVELGNQ